jgi:hypothetical protein
MRTGIANLPLHGGKAPAWLFNRMRQLAREIVKFITYEFGAEEVLNRLSDPFWFQCFGCVLGFDWHSSGVTTTVCGAVKEGIRGMEEELGFFAAGGKGATSRKTPAEIVGWAEKVPAIAPDDLVHASRMSAKVDSAAVQDGYQLYHHGFFFSRSNKWCVVQQGMNDANHYARRYHWLGDRVASFVNEPHAAVCAQEKAVTLNMVAGESEPCREVSCQISREKPEKLLAELNQILTLDMTADHWINRARDINPRYLEKTFLKVYEGQPADFAGLLGLEGVGPKTIRALSLISDIVYGARPSFRDPARYSFAHGGKDGTPYPVDRENYDLSIDVLRKALDRGKIDYTEKVKAFKRLAAFQK